MEDKITAQGENVPLEDRFQAFDGRLETKWLDHATKFPDSRASWIQWQYTSPADLVITNVQRLVALRNRASRATVFGWRRRRRAMREGQRHLSPGRYRGHRGSESLDTAQFVAGQRVLVAGTSQWTQQGQGSHNPVSAPGPKPASEPRRIALEQPLRPDEELRWSEVEGRIRFCSRSEQGLVVELEDNQQSSRFGIAARRNQPAARHRHPSPRAWFVRERSQRRGERVAGILWFQPGGHLGGRPG